MNKKRIPNFFLVGAPKAATSSLHYYLGQHPEIYMSELKEPHYFCEDFKQDNNDFGLNQLPLIMRDEDYLRLFEGGADAAILGDASTTNFYSALAAQKIAEFNTDARILIVLREPVSLINSWYQYLRYYSHENIDSITDALNAEAERKVGRRVPGNVFFRHFLYYREIVRFDTHINRYLEAFPLNQVLVLILDDIVADLDGQIRRVCSFLGVDDEFCFDLSTRVNERKSAKNPSLKYFVDKSTFKLQRKLLKHKDAAAIQLIHKLYSAVFLDDRGGDNENILSKESMSEELRPMLARTSAIIDRDLTELWGYS